MSAWLTEPFAGQDKGRSCTLAEQSLEARIMYWTRFSVLFLASRMAEPPAFVLDGSVWLACCNETSSRDLLACIDRISAVTYPGSGSAQRTRLMSFPEEFQYHTPQVQKTVSTNKLINECTALQACFACGSFRPRSSCASSAACMRV